MASSGKVERIAGKPQYCIHRLVFRLLHHLNRRRKIQLVLVCVLMLGSTFAEVSSLGAVLPFLAILTAPEKAMGYPVVAQMARILHADSATAMVLPLTILFILTALLAGAIRMIYLYLSTRLAFTTGADLSLEVYRRTLYQPYRVHVSRNSSTVVSAITHKIGAATTMLLSVLNLVISALLLVAVIATLLYIDTTVALVAAVSFGGSYGLLTWLVRHRLERNSELIARESTQVIKALQEGLGGIRDVLIDGTQSVHCDIFRDSQVPSMRTQGTNQFIGASPRYAMEALGVVLIAVLAYGLTTGPAGVANALPMLGALALGAQRLLPALQQGYASWIGIVGSKASLADALDLLDQPLPEEMYRPDPSPLPFRDQIRFEAVHFRYGGDSPWVLNGLSFSIPRGGRVGFVGRTGSGKSTTLDLLMGLLDPTAGRVSVDGQVLNAERRRAWQKTIGHVPQSIFLADSTLAENIAFGVPRKRIDMERVRHAARQAQISEFIEAGNKGYEAFVGERGIRLSGGQRQRIGIARALYKQASVLVFDEATSALDNATEQAVIDAIEGLNRDLTILLIAHRLTTVQRCDLIFELEEGRLVAQGSYDQLMKLSPSFNKLAQVAA